MTDVRCPLCDHAFFRSAPDTLPGHDSYWCRDCAHAIHLPTNPTPDTTATASEQGTVITCQHCPCATLDSLGIVTSIEDDRDHAYACSECDAAAYCVRLETAATATSPEYDGPNPFRPSTAAGSQTQLSDWGTADE